MGHPGRGVGVPMESAFPVFDSEVEAGEDLQPPKDHPGWRLQGLDLGECLVVSTQNERPVQKIVFVVLQEKDHCENFPFGGGIASLQW